MFELKNSKKIYLGKALDGSNKFAVDCFIGAVQMQELDGEWVDIKPRLVRKPTDDGYYVDRVPYYAEFNDDGSRLFCPDKYQRSEYFGLPTIPLLIDLTKNLVSSPTKLDGEILPSRIVMPAYWGEIRIPFTNTAMRFEVLFNEAPPSAIFGHDSPRIVFDTDLAGLDIHKLLSEKKGLGIPRPRLIDNDGIERWLDWSFRDGQLELGFDLVGLKFPVLLKNTTIDDQVDASTDDAHERESTGVVDLTNLTLMWVSSVYNYGRYWGGHRWVLGSSIPQGSTIGVAYVTGYIYSGYDDANVNLHFEKTAEPTTFTTDTGNITSRTRTTDSVSWVEDNVVGDTSDWHDTPSLVTPAQELVDAVSPLAIVLIARPNQDAAKACNSRSYDYSGYGAKLHIEYEAGGGAAASRGWWSK